MQRPAKCSREMNPTCTPSLLFATGALACGMWEDAVAFCSPAKSLTFSGLRKIMENPLVGKNQSPNIQAKCTSEGTGKEAENMWAKVKRRSPTLSPCPPQIKEGHWCTPKGRPVVSDKWALSTSQRGCGKQSQVSHQHNSLTLQELPMNYHGI